MTCKGACSSHSGTVKLRAPAEEIRSFFRQISCECATFPRYDAAPVARELFGRIEGQGQSPIEAAKALGLGPRDCAYLLAGFRPDLAQEIVALLLTGPRDPKREVEGRF